MVLIYGLILLFLLAFCPIGLLLLVGMSFFGMILKGIKGK